MSRCVWLERDAEGRPRCEHGWAIKANRTGWRCREKHRRNNRKWERGTGREWLAARARSDAQRTSKALYELTRVRAM